MRYYKKNILFVIVILFISGSLGAKNKSLPWGVGEKLTFSIRWGMITCGYAHMEVKEKITFAGRETYRIVSTARSVQFFDAFYKVRDRAESYIDTEYLRSNRYEQSNREGGYKKDLVIIYDHAHKVAYEYDLKRDPEFKKGKKFDITENIQDILSAMYVLRTIDLEVGKEYEMDVGTGKRTWELIIEVIKKEKIRVPAGKFKTFLVIPRLKEDGLFKAKGDLHVWLTADRRKYPVKMKSKIEFGSISVVLIEKRLAK